MDRTIYDRARAAGIPARYALALARTDHHPLVPDYGSPVTFDRDGFTITATLDYDGGMTLADLGYGHFLDGSEDWRTGYERRPDPDAVPNPHRDSRNPSNGAGWYVPGAAGTLRERYAEYRRDEYGMSRAVAWDKARESVEDELRTVTDDYGPAAYVLRVEASRNGIDLGSASLGGIEVGQWDPITRSHGEAYLAEAMDDIAPEAIAEAREALAGLLEGIA